MTSEPPISANPIIPTPITRIMEIWQRLRSSPESESALFQTPAWPLIIESPGAPHALCPTAKLSTIPAGTVLGRATSPVMKRSRSQIVRPRK
jgi:hypothetical protein